MQLLCFILGRSHDAQFVWVFTISKTRKYKNRIRYQWPRIPPAMLAMCSKQECVPRF